MQRDREWRRAQRERKIQRVERWMNERNWLISVYDDRPREEKQAECHEAALRRHSAPRGCSCWMCGNPRKWHKQGTLAEKRFDLHCREVYQDEGLEFTPPPPPKRSY